MNKIISAFLCLCSLFIASSALGQGALTPPGAPAPSMKSLDQIAPRTPISSAPFSITQPGSYYLTTNLTVSGGNSAIIISTPQVTLDLNGFTISSTSSPANGYGVEMFVPLGKGDILISNGHIVGGVTNNGSVFGGTGFGSGIDLPGSAIQNVRVTGVTVSGCANYGIYLGTFASTAVEGCTVINIGGQGITASSVSHSTAYQCATAGISADSVSDCDAQVIGSGTAIACKIAHNCWGLTGSGVGVDASRIAIGCSGDAGSASGIGLRSGGTAESCTGSNGGGGTAIKAVLGVACVKLSGTNSITTPSLGTVSP